ncbi:MAG: hypothetical protein KBG80_04105 [Breznakibacter sp.]|nr:hypothetical protein [Breznakibacter sp.]
MTIAEITELLSAKVVCGKDFIHREVHRGFASDLMSDVLTLDTDSLLLITGLCNLQTIRTSEMADISCILFVRGKKVTPEMRLLATELDMILLECECSMFRAISTLNNAGLEPVY